MWNMATVIHLDILSSVTQCTAGKRWQNVTLRKNRRRVKFNHFHLQSTNDMTIYVEPL